MGSNPIWGTMRRNQSNGSNPDRNRARRIRKGTKHGHYAPWNIASVANDLYEIRLNKGVRAKRRAHQRQIQLQMERMRAEYDRLKAEKALADKEETETTETDCIE